MSPALPRAAIAAEDARFCTHHGFDFNAIEKAVAHNDERRPSRIRGGSTISQQTAKNVFLWPDRSWVRKGFEAYFTVLIEAIWGKRRIMEVYLNTVEMGPGVYGVEAAAQTLLPRQRPRREPGPGRAADRHPAQPAEVAGDRSRLVRAPPRPRIGSGEGAVQRIGGAECVS